MSAVVLGASDRPAAAAAADSDAPAVGPCCRPAPPGQPAEAPDWAGSPWSRSAAQPETRHSLPCGPRPVAQACCRWRLLPRLPCLRSAGETAPAAHQGSEAAPVQTNPWTSAPAVRIDRPGHWRAGVVTTARQP